MLCNQFKNENTRKPKKKKTEMQVPHLKSTPKTQNFLKSTTNTLKTTRYTEQI